MCNCNKKRNNTPPPVRTAPQAGQTSNKMVRVQLTTNKPVVFYGSYTGRMYRLNGVNSTSWVDRRDASALGGMSGIRVL